MRSGKKLIAVQPLGGIREDVLEVIAANLQAFFQIRTKVFPDLPMLEGAYSSHRSQYNCHPILKFLGASKPHDAIKIIGVTDIDLFIPILTYVFGEAELGGQCSGDLDVSACQSQRPAAHSPKTAF
ncbi:MAG TPA: hypothetical protein EYP19_13565 [Desulfobacterales bacterium]|nr:hypothetical protein [Desulfobacterales bacterium]